MPPAARGRWPAAITHSRGTLILPAHRYAAQLGEDDPDLVEGNASYELLESLPIVSRACSSIQIRIDDLDGVGIPAVLKSPLPEGVLKVPAVLVRQRLMRTGRRM
jgi:hypothetical protein